MVGMLTHGRDIKCFLKKNKFSKYWKYEIENLGYKYNMNDLTAAIGLAQLKKVNYFNKKEI